MLASGQQQRRNLDVRALQPTLLLPLTTTRRRRKRLLD
jgi:hypothetical protein